jgi:hypothetical protein
MRAFFRYLADYFRSISRPALVVTILFVAALIAGNYRLGIESRIQALPWYAALGTFFAFFALVLALTWGLQYEWGYKDKALTQTPTLRGARRKTLRVISAANPAGYFKPKMIGLLALACLYFALKMIHWDIYSLLSPAIKAPWDRYTALVLQLPLKLLLLFGFLYAFYKAGLFDGESFTSAVGLDRRNSNLGVYFLLLLVVLPLVALAATQHDFQLVYPKLQNLSFLDGVARPTWPWKLLYELSYGLDFLGIELFFRGLLVIALLRFAGTDAILPMAAFYCTIHFGKPLGECISSFFGGLILGVLAARTRTIYGGLIVHLGLAWAMELAGWIAHLFTTQ